MKHKLQPNNKMVGRVELGISKTFFIDRQRHAQRLTNH